MMHETLSVAKYLGQAGHKLSRKQYLYSSIVMRQSVFTVSECKQNTRRPFQRMFIPRCLLSISFRASEDCLVLVWWLAEREE